MDTILLRVRIFKKSNGSVVPLVLIRTMRRNWRQKSFSFFFSFSNHYWAELAESKITTFRKMQKVVFPRGKDIHNCFQPDIGRITLKWGKEEISQARILEWVAISFSRRSPRPRDWTQVSYIVGGLFTDWVTREARGKTSHPFSSVSRA